MQQPGDQQYYSDNEIVQGEYRPVRYLQFSASPMFRLVQAVIGIMMWPVILPLVLLSKLSDILFRAASEFLSLIPYFPGIIARYEFYRFALKRCGKNVLIEFGTIFIYPDVQIGDNVLIGRYSIVHHCDFGSYVLAGERCTFLSGSKQHGFERSDMPIALQAGQKKRIKIHDDCWIGSHSVVAEDVGSGSIVGAGSMVIKPLAANSKIRPPSPVVTER